MITAISQAVPSVIEFATRPWAGVSASAASSAVFLTRGKLTAEDAEEKTGRANGRGQLRSMLKRHKGTKTRRSTQVGITNLVRLCVFVPLWHDPDFHKPLRPTRRSGQLQDFGDRL